MKHSFLTILGLLLFSAVNAQLTVEKSTDWKLIFENEKIQFFSKYTDCSQPQEGLFVEYVLLKAVNKTEQPVLLSWYNDVYTESKGCVTCDREKNELKRSVVLKPLETQEGDCALGLNIGLKVFSRWLQMENHQALDKLVITDLSTDSPQH